MKHIFSKVSSWWKSKNALGKILTVVSCFAIVCIVGICGLFVSAYSKDVARQKARQAATEEELLKTAIVKDGITYVKNQNIVTFLFMGIDNKLESDVNSRSLKSDGTGRVMGQSDAIMLAAFDMDAETVKLVNIPRDSMVYVDEKTMFSPDRDHVYEQLTLQYAYARNEKEAVRLMKNVISTQIFEGLNIDYYAAMNFVAVPKIVDDLGGLDITMSNTYDIYVYNDAGGMEPRHYDAGQTYHLYGYDAAGIAQYRDIEVYGSAMGRIERQKDFIRALYHDAKEAIKENPSLIAKIYGDVKENLNTDLTLPDLISLASTALDADFSADEIVILPGEIGTEPIEGEEDSFHQTYELDKEGVQQIMLDTWYVPYEGAKK